MALHFTKEEFENRKAKVLKSMKEQNLNSLLGKLLRLDVDLAAPYIPTDNPYLNDANALDEIWAYGLRNPWKFSFDSISGNIWIADVGQNAIEEIILDEKKLNYMKERSEKIISQMTNKKLIKKIDYFK